MNLEVIQNTSPAREKIDNKKSRLFIAEIFCYVTTMQTFPELVRIDLEKARTKHPGGMHSCHEAYGVILEELDEFWDLVRQQKPDKREMLDELVSVAAMCQRAAEDLELTQP